jgi:hypothetical protein
MSVTCWWNYDLRILQRLPLATARRFVEEIREGHGRASALHALGDPLCDEIRNIL